MQAHDDALSGRCTELEEQLRRATEEVCILRRVSTRINATLDLEQIYEITLHTMREVFDFSHALILLQEEGSEMLQVVAGGGYPEPPIGARVEPGVGVIGTVARRKKMMRVGNLSQQRAYAAAVRKQVEETDGAGTLG